MRPASRKAFVMASVIHVAFALLVLLFTFWKPAEREVEPVSFEVFAPPSSSPAEQSPAPEPEITPVSFNFTPPPPPPPPPKPTPPPPEPPPPPKPKPEPPPPPKPAPPAPKPEPPPPPKPEPRVSFEDFRKKDPQRQPQQRQAAPPPKPVNVPRIDTTAITRNLENMLPREQAAQVSQQSSGDQAALNSYFERIRSAVRGAWAKPQGLNDALRVTVRFDVTADGRLTNVSIASSSGNSIFDQSVLEAFRRVGSVGPSPDRQPYSLRLTFRMTD